MTTVGGTVTYNASTSVAQNADITSGGGAIGVTAGMGHESTAVLCTAIAFLILSTLGRIERWFEARSEHRGQAPD